MVCLLLHAVHPAEVTVPADGNDIGEQDTMLQGHECEVDHLDEGPDQPIRLQRRPPGLLQPLLGAYAFHSCHAAQEDTDHDRSEGTLVTPNACESLEAWSSSDIHSAGKEIDPCGHDRAKHDLREGRHVRARVPSISVYRVGNMVMVKLTATVEGHATGTGKVMLLQTPLLNSLLGSNVSSSEQNCSRHTLCEKWLCCQLRIVPL